MLSNRVEYNISRDKRFCEVCGSTETYIHNNNRKTPQWYRATKGGSWDKWICFKCYGKKNQGRRIFFKNKVVILKENPRKYFCNSCLKEHKVTAMHHNEYHDDDPLKDTIEYCISCHLKIEGRKRDPKTGRFIKS